MPSYYRDPTAPRPNRPRLVGVVALIELEGSILVDRRWPAATPIRDAYLVFDGTPVVA